MILFIFIFLHKYALLLFRETSKFITNFLTKKMLHNNALVKC